MKTIHKSHILNAQNWIVGKTYNFLLRDGSDVRGKIISINTHYIKIQVIEE